MKTRKQQVRQAIRDAIRVKLAAYRLDYTSAKTEAEAHAVVAKILAVTARRDQLPTTGGRHRLLLAHSAFGRLHVMFECGSNARSNTLWLCRCECGTRKCIDSDSLVRGRTQSCGCLRRERFAAKSPASLDACAASAN